MAREESAGIDSAVIDHHFEARGWVLTESEDLHDARLEESQRDVHDGVASQLDFGTHLQSNYTQKLRLPP